MKTASKQKWVNPMSKPGVRWMWFVLLPIAIIAYIHFDVKHSVQKSTEKRRRKQEEFHRKHWEYDAWMDDQGL